MLTNTEFLIEQQEWSNYEMIDSDKRRNGNEKRHGDKKRSNNKKGNSRASNTATRSRTPTRIKNIHHDETQMLDSAFIFIVPKIIGRRMNFPCSKSRIG